jgi:hypothetical protein
MMHRHRRMGRPTTEMLIHESGLRVEQSRRMTNAMERRTSQCGMGMSETEMARTHRESQQDETAPWMDQRISWTHAMGRRTEWSRMGTDHSSSWIDWNLGPCHCSVSPSDVRRTEDRGAMASNSSMHPRKFRWRMGGSCLPRTASATCMTERSTNRLRHRTTRSKSRYSCRWILRCRSNHSPLPTLRSVACRHRRQPTIHPCRSRGRNSLPPGNPR